MSKTASSNAWGRLTKVGPNTIRRGKVTSRPFINSYGRMCVSVVWNGLEHRGPVEQPLGRTGDYFAKVAWF